MAIYGAAPTRPVRKRGGWWRRRPRWFKITAGVLGVVLLALIVAGGALALYLHSAYESITKLSSNDQHASHGLVQVQNISTTDAPITALVIGSDHRGKTEAGQWGLSDTLMLVRIDPQHHMASLFSIPRDLWVSAPGYGPAKINGAYSLGGDNLALQAVKAVTGVHPNYLLNVDFNGFRAMVNALGGVYVPVDEYYYNPSSISSANGFSEIYIQPGYQQLSGRDALAFSRYRHSDDDFHREARQQLFLKTFENRAATRFHGISVTDLPAINDLIHAIKGHLTIVGPGGHQVTPQTLVTFAATIYGVRSHVVSSKPPVWVPFTGTDGSDAETVDAAALQHAISLWRTPWKVATAGSTIPPGKTKPHKPAWTPSVTPSSVSVSVVNGNGVAGAAGKATKQLRAWGYTAHAGGNAPKFNYATSVVYYKPGSQAAANDVAHIVGSATAQPLPASLSKITKPVALVIGKSYKGTMAVNPPASVKPYKPPATIQPTSEYRDYFAQAQHHVHFRTLYPSVSQANSSFCPYSPTPPAPGLCSDLGSDPIRTYNLPAAGGGQNSMYAMFKMGNGDYWGVEETRFTDAPILQSPNATRKLDTRTYRFFYNGPHIQTVGFVKGGIAYWVQNTLTDLLTNGEMIAIARSLKPVAAH